MTIDPTVNLTPSLDYSAQISTGATSNTGVALAAPVIWSFTTSAAPAGSASQLYPDTTTPVTDGNAVQDGRTGAGPFSYETGVKVQATLGAEIRAVRFYKSPGETGTHVGRIWTEAGTAARPDHVHGRDHVRLADRGAGDPAGDHGRPDLRHLRQPQRLLPRHPRGPRHPDHGGPRAHIVGSNGVYGDAAGTFPTTSWNNSSYLVDLVVAPTEGVAPPASPRR